MCSTLFQLFVNYSENENVLVGIIIVGVRGGARP